MYEKTITLSLEWVSKCSFRTRYKFFKFAIMMPQIVRTWQSLARLS